MESEFDYNVMMDLDDDFARENAGYGGHGMYPYDPTFNPHGVGAYCEYDSGSNYGFDPEMDDEDEGQHLQQLRDESSSSQVQV